jgi:Spy/CpxP family protein refolding chaperone
MYPGMMGWWKHAHFAHGGHGHDGHHEEGRAECGPSEGVEGPAGCGPGAGRHEGRGGRGRGWGRGFGGGFDPHEFAHLKEVLRAADHEGHFGGFGVRRPLRFLAYKLELEENQVEELASILNDLKTERAQGEVDHRRSTAAIAAAIAGETLDAAQLTAATDDRVKSAERLRDAVVKAIGRIHKMLTAEQRTRFAYLIRTGALTI